MRNQVRELLTNYGKIDILWFDFSYSAPDEKRDLPWMKGKGKEDWESEKLIALARELQPGLVCFTLPEIKPDVIDPVIEVILKDKN